MKHVRLLALLSLILLSCEKEMSQEGYGPASLPVVTTTTVTSITNTSAASGGTISGTGGAAITVRGVCWSTTPTPVVTGDHTTDGTGSGSFPSLMTGLIANTVYYVRAYATNIAGTAYGNELTFTTTSSSTALPTVTTAVVTAITAATATGGGTVTADGGAAVSARGICWSTTINPVVSGNHTIDGSGLGPFSGSMTGLTANTTYHVRAYATNSVGTAYGTDVTFTTTTVTPPPTGTIYIAGYESNGSKNVAKYWKNSVAVNLTDGTNNAQATQIIMVGSDIYVSGYEATAGSSKQAKYWKNGTAVNLAANATEQSMATGIAVTGADVYVAVRYQASFPDPTAAIIRNGVATDLSGGFFPSAANAVFIQSPDIYVAGRHGFYQATYWKNSTVVNLPATETNTETAAFAIYVSGADIYTAGFEKTSLAFGNIEVAKSWKNGAATNLTNGTFHAAANAITLSGADVYAAGYEENAAGNGVAKYWRNNVAVNLTDGSKDAEAFSIVVK